MADSFGQFNDAFGGDTLPQQGQQGGQSQGQPTNGMPQFGAPQQGQPQSQSTQAPQQGMPQFGASQQGQPQTPQGQFGQQPSQPQGGQSQFGTPFGQAQGGQPTQPQQGQFGGQANPYAEQAGLGQQPQGGQQFGQQSQGQPQQGQFSSQAQGQTVSGQPQNPYTEQAQLPVEPQRVDPIPEPYASLGANGYLDNAVYLGKAQITSINFGDAQSTDDQGQVHVYAGDPTHRIRIGLRYQFIGQVIDDIVTVTIDSTEKDKDGKVIGRQVSNKMQKIADAQLHYAFSQIPGFDSADYVAVAELTNVDDNQIAAKNMQIHLWRDGEFLKIAPYSFAGGSYIDPDDINYQAFQSDLAIPGQASVPAKLIAVEYSEFKSGKNAGLPYIRLKFETDYGMILARNIDYGGNHNKSLKLSMNNSDPNRDLGLVFALGAFIGTAPDQRGATSIEQLVRTLTPNPDVKFKVSIDPTGQTRSDGSLAWIFVAKHM